MQSDFSWIVPIEVMAGYVYHGEVQACSIINVPEKFRQGKKYAYEPKHISIGPLHRGATRRLTLMEEPKWHYMIEFLDREGVTSDQNRRAGVRLRDCGFDILKIIEVVYSSYGGRIPKIIKEIEPHELAKVMIVDGCFLLEFLIELGNYMENQITTFGINDFFHRIEEDVLNVLNDVTMLENQIPFLVLKKLYRTVFPLVDIDIKDDHRVANIVCKAFGYPLMHSTGATHILHLMHLSTVEQSQNHHHYEGKKAKLELFCCATQLHASGVIIRAKNSATKYQHEFVDMFDFDISFSDSGELNIPPLYIKKTTEVKWRNLIVWEQSKSWARCKYTSYALFFNGLICCEHDIELLEKKGVIVNESNKSNRDLLALFRTISNGAEHMDLSFSEICASLNVYSHKEMKITKVFKQLPTRTWHQYRKINFHIVVDYGKSCYKILIRDHIPTVWKFVGIVAAAMLLILTIMQTYYASRANK